MNILWFTHIPCVSGSEPGGTTGSGGWIVALKDALKHTGAFHLDIAYLSSDPGDETPVVSDGVRYFPIRPFKASSYVGFRVRRRLMSRKSYTDSICKRMSDIIFQTKPDVIHIHGTEKPFVSADYAVFQGIPVVCSIQGLVNVVAEKFFSGIPESEVRKFERVSDHILKRSMVADLKNFRIHSGSERRFLEQVRYVIGRTDWDRRITGLLNPGREYFHVDELMRAPFYTSCWSHEGFSVQFRIVSVMSYGPYKGFETVLKAAALLKKYAGFDFSWTIAGYSGSEGYVGICEKSIGISARDVNIRFAGKVDAAALSHLLCESDLFCHTSHVDNSPNSVCEAMLIGMPLIASGAGGTCSLLEDGKEGVIVQDGDPYALAGAICEIHSDFTRAAAMGAAARRRAQERHSPEKVCAELLQVYSVIAESGL